MGRESAAEQVAQLCREPQVTGVDGSDEYLSGDSGDVTIDDANLHDSS